MVVCVKPFPGFAFTFDLFKGLAIIAIAHALYTQAIAIVYAFLTLTIYLLTCRTGTIPALAIVTPAEVALALTVLIALAITPTITFIVRAILAFTNEYRRRRCGARGSNRLKICATSIKCII